MITSLYGFKSPTNSSLGASRTPVIERALVSPAPQTRALYKPDECESIVG
jgi:hypothetical protein